MAEIIKKQEAQRTRLETVIPLETPIELQLAVASVCNYRCGYCPISDKKSLDMACNYSNGAIIGTKFINSLDVLNLNKSIEKFINSILL